MRPQLSTKPCPTIDDPETADLTWLMHRTVGALASVFDGVCQASGLADHRDWLVLATTGDGERRTQFELSQSLGIDKSTLMAIIDRLEAQGLVARELSPADRRVRIPVATPQGITVTDQVTLARDAALAERLTVVPAADQIALRHTLWSILTSQPLPGRD